MPGVYKVKPAVELTATEAALAKVEKARKRKEQVNIKLEEEVSTLGYASLASSY